jgi:hypothetical protein
MAGSGACNVLQDSIFVENLERHNPFLGMLAARFLKADFFKNTRDGDASARSLKLS